MTVAEMPTMQEVQHRMDQDDLLQAALVALRSLRDFSAYGSSSGAALNLVRWFGEESAAEIVRHFVNEREIRVNALDAITRAVTELENERAEIKGNEEATA